MLPAELDADKGANGLHFVHSQEDKSVSEGFEVGSPKRLRINYPWNVIEGRRTCLCRNFLGDSFI